MQIPCSFYYSNSLFSCQPTTPSPIPSTLLPKQTRSAVTYAYLSATPAYLTKYDIESTAENDPTCGRSTVATMPSDTMCK